MTADTAYTANVLKNTHGRDSFRVAMHHCNHELFGVWLAQKTGGETIDDVDPHLLFSLDFFLRAAVESMIDWLDRDRPVPPETLARWICDGMPEDLKPYLLG